MGKTFGLADIVVFVLTVVVSLGIGIYYALAGDRQRTTSEYMVGGRVISYLPVSISLLASFESSIMMLGYPAEGYFYGTQLMVGVLGSLLTYFMTAYAMVPLMYSLQITSAFEYLDLRFQSKMVRRLGTAMGMLLYVWYMGIVLFGPAVALEAVTGFPTWVSIMAISLVSVIYTSIGGMKAVVWADVFQCAIMFMGIFAILIQGTIKVGGPKKVWDVAMEGKRLELFNFDPDPRVRHTFWCLTFGRIVRNLNFAFNQATVQRICSTRTLQDARRVIYIVAPCFFFVTIVAIYEGVVAYSYFQTKGCDPLENGDITNPNQLLPYMVMEIFDDLPGMPGLFLASLFSASLSSLSTGLSSLSAMTWCDVIQPLMGDNISDVTGTVFAKLAVLIFGGVACGIAFLVALIGGTLNQISFSVLSSFGAPTASLFFMGCFCPRVTAKGATTGGIIGLIITCWISFGMNFSPDVIPSPTLPPASIAQCVADNTTQGSTISPFLLLNNTSTTLSTVDGYSLTMMTTDGPDMDHLEGLAILYNLSYQWIPVIGMIVTVLAGYIASLIMGPNKPGDVDPRYLLQVSTSITYFLPSRLQRWMSTFGTQFHKVEYKANFPSPVLHEKVRIPDPTADDVIMSTSGHGLSKRQLLRGSSTLEVETTMISENGGQTV